MARNFTLTAIASNIQYGLAGPRLKQTGSTQFEFRDAADAAFVNVSGADAAALQDFVTLNQLNAVSVGIQWKESVRVASNVNVSVASAPALIDGVAPSVGDRIALLAQTTGSENGLWVYQGAGNALTRPTDWATGTNQSGSAFFIREATFADQAFVATADPAVVDTDDPVLVNFATTTPGVIDISNIDDGGGAGTFAPLVAVGTGNATIRSISNGPQISANPSGGGNQVDLAIVADSVTETELAPGVAVLYRHVQVNFGDFPATTGDADVNLGAVLPANAIVKGGQILVTTAFNNGATMQVGTSSTPSAIFGATENDLSTPGTDNSSNASVQSGAQLIARLTTAATQPTAGSAEVMANFIRPS